MPRTRKRTTSTQDRTPEEETNPNSSQATSGIVPAKRLTDKEELSIVIYRLLEESGTVKLKAMPLDFVCFSKSHTGEYLANMICGMVTNNAKNNDVMVRELKKLKWPCFQGNTQWIRCFAHILNLIAQAMLRPFGAQKKNGATDNPGSKPDGIDSGNESAQEQISMLPRRHKATLQDEESSSDVDSNFTLDEGKTESLGEADIENASEEDEDNCYKSASCKQTLAKFCVIAKKLRFLPNSKAKFVKILLHPSFRDEYFKLANWEPEWISKAIQLARDMWVSLNKPKPMAPSSSAPAPNTVLSSKPKTGRLILNGTDPVNPLQWWIQQKALGNTHGGLVHMALDVLSCPATSVDVKRAFSFGRDYVSSKRHRLAHGSPVVPPLDSPAGEPIPPNSPPLKSPLPSPPPVSTTPEPVPAPVPEGLPLTAPPPLW
ncbi:hypothetical protein PCASD_01972 [Puccinia coronata f. sp. avenae]|uniref:HAT C-terminal dimerisation domain-containing protein n=1 Tax=Puccinia coronata f. sp. avenae TaxID=200324 RepID=A0A2N5VHD0_9BASI|nr:hypothetical protein PCASD_01972 [Puccinia coronata f. sp. avenae]